MEKITKLDDKCIIVKIPIGIHQRNNLYEATRRCWRVNLNKAKMADYVLGIIKEEVKCVIKISSCDYVKTEFCKKENKICKIFFNVNTELCKRNRRIAFEGKVINTDKKYLNKTVPHEYLPMQNPVRYTY